MDQTQAAITGEHRRVESGGHDQERIGADAYRKAFQVPAARQVDNAVGDERRRRTVAGEASLARKTAGDLQGAAAKKIAAVAADRKQRDRVHAAVLGQVSRSGAAHGLRGRCQQAAAKAICAVGTGTVAERENAADVMGSAGLREDAAAGVAHALRGRRQQAAAAEAILAAAAGPIAERETAADTMGSAGLREGSRPGVAHVLGVGCRQQAVARVI